MDGWNSFLFFFGFFWNEIYFIHSKHQTKKYKNPSQEFPQNLKKTYYTFSVNLGIWQFRVVFLHCVYQKNILKAATKKKKLKTNEFFFFFKMETKKQKAKS